MSADGEELTWLDPATAPELSDADEVVTNAMALDSRGNLLTLIWARWVKEGGEFGERGEQHIVSFDDDGYNSQVEVDWREMHVRQFEAFGSGDLLLRGMRGSIPRERLSIMSRRGGELRDVVGWPNYPALWEDDAPEAEEGTPFFDQIVRGGDGRIYLTAHEHQEDTIRVYSLDPSDGHTREAFRLASVPRAHRLLGVKAAGRRFAALYGAPPSPDGEDSGARYRIEVYADVGGYERHIVYEPAPGPPLCYQYSETQGDLFVFLEVGAGGEHLLTSMSRRR